MASATAATARTRKVEATPPVTQTATMRRRWGTRSSIQWARRGGTSGRPRPSRNPTPTPREKTSVGRMIDCGRDGEASGCAAERATAAESSATTPIETSRPTTPCGVSPMRRPARIASSTVTSENPSSAIVATMPSPAPASPRPAASAGSRVKVRSAPWPSSHASTAARQKTTQSSCSPYWNDHMSVRGTSGMPMPTPTTSSASRAANRAVSGRFMTRATLPSATGIRRSARSPPPDRTRIRHAHPGAAGSESRGQPVPTRHSRADLDDPARDRERTLDQQSGSGSGTTPSTRKASTVSSMHALPRA